jgi:hypothetical protein
MVGLLAGVIAVMLAASAPVSAGIIIGPHSGHYGVHTPIDTGEYAGAICGYSNIGQLDTIKIRRPIVFAFDRTGGVDTQKVGWRFNIEYSIDGNNWSTWNTSSILTATATDKVNAHFMPRTYHLTNPVKTTYFRVTLDLYWFYPDVHHVNGQANHVIAWYQIGPQVGLGTWCPEQQPKTVVTPPPPGHSGKYGVHTLIDTIEYPGVTCRYHNAVSDYLYKITVRPPILFGFDRTAGLDSQTVGWRYTIQYTDDNVTWHKLVTSSIVKANATDQANAAWQSRSFTFASRPNHAHYRVVVGLFWYYPTASHQNGKAVHPVIFYRGSPDGGMSFLDSVCAISLG